MTGLIMISLALLRPVEDELFRRAIPVSQRFRGEELQQLSGAIVCIEGRQVCTERAAMVMRKGREQE